METTQLQTFVEQFKKDVRDASCMPRETEDDKKLVNERLTKISNDLKQFEQTICSAQFELSAYEKRKSRNILKNMMQNLAQLRRMCFPRQRFSFASRKYLTSTTEIKLEEVKAIESDANYVISDLENAFKIVSKQQGGGDYRLYNIKNSIIILNFLSDTVYIDDCNNSIIINGVSEGAVHMERCNNCCFVLASHQIRMHESHFCKIAMICGSRPIIENCDNFEVGSIINSISSKNAEEDGEGKKVSIDKTYLRNAKILEYIPLYIEDLAKAKLNKYEFDDNHTLIRDFTWIKQEASPNWRNNEDCLNIIFNEIKKRNTIDSNKDDDDNK